MTATKKTCRDCGAPFDRSRADSTVRCPACRAERRERRASRTSSADFDAYVRVAVARNAARKARSKFGTGSPEYAAAVADFERVSGTRVER